MLGRRVGQGLVQRGVQQAEVGRGTGTHSAGRSARVPEVAEEQSKGGAGVDGLLRPEGASPAVRRVVAAATARQGSGWLNGASVLPATATPASSSVRQGQRWGRSTGSTSTR